MKVVLVRFKDGERREFPVTEETTVLGRRPECDLRIPTNDVSRQHCQLLLTDDELLVKDLGSSNGTYVNGKRIAETKLSAGDRLVVGPVVFVVQVDGEPAKISPSDASIEVPTGQSPAAEGGGEGEVFELGEGDFDIDDAIADLGNLDEDKDLP